MPDVRVAGMTPVRVAASPGTSDTVPKGDTLADASVLSVDTPTSGDAIDQARAGLPAGHVITSMAR